MDIIFIPTSRVTHITKHGPLNSIYKKHGFKDKEQEKTEINVSNNNNYGGVGFAEC